MKRLLSYIFSRGSMIITSTSFTRLQQAFKLKFAPLFAPLTNLLKQTSNLKEITNECVVEHVHAHLQVYVAHYVTHQFLYTWNVDVSCQ